MNRSDLINELRETNGLTIKEANLVIDSIVNKITNSLELGEKVVITGLGSFNPVRTKKKKGRNPKTGEEVIIRPRRKVKFVASKTLFK